MESRLLKADPQQLLKVEAAFGEQMPKETLEFFMKNQREAPVRSSPLVVLDSCKRMFLYEYRFGIKPKSLDSALTMGSLVHLVLASLFQGSTKEVALAAAEASLTEYKAKLTGWVDRFGFLPNGKDLKSSLVRLDEDYHKAVAMAFCFWHYCPFPSHEWEVLKDPDGKPMVEQLLMIEAGDAYQLRTPCDLVLKNKRTGKIWIADFKTTSFDPMIRSIPTKFSIQLKLYRLVLQMHLNSWGRGEVVAGSIHALIKKPTIKFCAKDDSFEAYIQRVITWYKDLQEKEPGNPPLMRDPNTFQGPLIDAELAVRLENYQKFSTTENFDLGVFYRNDSACLKYNRACPYMQLCNSDPSMWPLIVKDRFQISFREDEEEQD